MTCKKFESDSNENHEQREYLPELELSLVIPLHNEMDNVKPLYQAICASLDPTGGSREVIFVDDGSDDATLQELESISLQDQRVRVLRLRRNVGQTVAMQTGIEHARGKIIVTMDGDLQNDPCDIPALVARINEGYDLVTGWRLYRQDRFISRRFPSLVANWFISRFLGIPTHDLGCTLKAYRSNLIRRIPLYSDLHRFIPAVCSMASTRIDEVVVRHHPRRYGQTKYGISRVGRVLFDALTVKMLVSCARRPLHWFGYWAVTMFLLAGLASISSVYVALHSTWRSTLVLPGVAILLGYLGMHLLFSGIFGEIVVRSEPQERVKTLVSVTLLNEKTWQ